MKRLFKMAFVFIIKSKMLSISVFISIFVACFLSVSMFQLSSNMERSIEKVIEEEKGAFDLRLTRRDGESFNEEEIEFFKNDKDVKNIATGYQTSELLDTYMVGVTNDEINKSLYKHTKDIKDNQIIINDILGRRENKKVGDTFTIAGKNLEIIEVIETASISNYKMPMAIMELSMIHELIGHSDTYMPNYLLLVCHDSAYFNIERGGGIVNRIWEHSQEYNISDQREGGQYDVAIKVVKLIFTVFFVIIIVISGLFVVNIFLEYMRKYRRDMAVIRTVGGKQEQIKNIFCSMSVIISGSACFIGTLFSALVSESILNRLNKKMQLFEGYVSVNWKMLWLIVIIVFLVFNFFIYLVFVSCQKVLPIQVFQDTSSGLRKNKRANRFLALRRIIGKEGYLGVKLMSSQFRRNFMMILIVALITTIAYTGQTTLKFLMVNDYWYNLKTFEGKTATVEINNIDKPMSLSYVRKLHERFQNVMGSGFILYGDFELKLDDEYVPVKASELERVPQFYQTEVWEGCDNVPKTKRIVMGKILAAVEGYKLGDTVTLESDYFEGKKEFVLVELVGGDDFYYSDLRLIDWDNLPDKTGNSDEKNIANCHDGTYVSMWLEGDKEVIREKFQQLQAETGMYFDSKIYDDVMEQSDKSLYQWTTTMYIVLGMLLLVAGIGLLNFANGMLYAKKNEYRILCMLGATKRSINKICWMQILSYMFSGVVIGAILGFIIVVYIWEGRVIINTPITIQWEYLIGIVFYIMALSMLLYPTVNKLMKNIFE